MEGGCRYKGKHRYVDIALDYWLFLASKLASKNSLIISGSCCYFHVSNLILDVFCQVETGKIPKDPGHIPLTTSEDASQKTMLSLCYPKTDLSPKTAFTWSSRLSEGFMQADGASYKTKRHHSRLDHRGWEIILGRRALWSFCLGSPGPECFVQCG